MSDEEGDDSDAIRQMMGFSSFGTSQRPKKEPQAPTSGAFSASGANSAPIAKRAKTSNTTSKIQPLSSSPPTFWPASLSPQPKSTTSYGTMSSAQSYNTTREYQPLPATSPDTSGSWNGPPSSHSMLSYSPQTAPYAAAPGTIPAPSTQQTHHAPPGTLPSSSRLDPHHSPPPGPTIPTPSPQNSNSIRLPAPPAYTNPSSGISLTLHELAELRNGRANARGDVVYFQPSFVDPDPWSGLRNAGRGTVH